MIRGHASVLLALTLVGSGYALDPAGIGRTAYLDAHEALKHMPSAPPSCIGRRGRNVCLAALAEEDCAGRVQWRPVWAPPEPRTGPPVTPHGALRCVDPQNDFPLACDDPAAVRVVNVPPPQGLRLQACNGRAATPHVAPTCQTMEYDAAAKASVRTLLRSRYGAAWKAFDLDNPTLFQGPRLNYVTASGRRLKDGRHPLVVSGFRRIRPAPSGVPEFILVAFDRCTGRAVGVADDG